MAILDREELECLMEAVKALTGSADGIALRDDGVFITERTDIPDSTVLATKADEIRLSKHWDHLRYERDRLLAASDWTQAADAPVDKAAWMVYRQALRDLPGNTVDPVNPVWPIQP